MRTIAAILLTVLLAVNLVCAFRALVVIVMGVAEFADVAIGLLNLAGTLVLIYPAVVAYKQVCHDG